MNFAEIKDNECSLGVYLYTHTIPKWMLFKFHICKIH